MAEAPAAMYLELGPLNHACPIGGPQKGVSGYLILCLKLVSKDFLTKMSIVFLFYSSKKETANIPYCWLGFLVCSIGCDGHCP